MVGDFPLLQFTYGLVKHPCRLDSRFRLYLLKHGSRWESVQFA